MKRKVERYSNATTHNTYVRHGERVKRHPESLNNGYMELKEHANISSTILF